MPGELVGQVAAQNAIFDQNRLVRCGSLVIHIQRATPRGDGAVVDDSDLRAGDLLSDQPRKGRGLFAVEVGLKAMPYGLVEQDSRPARAQNHLHLTGRRRHGAQLQNGSARGLCSQVFRAF